ncbi:hypothetical protein ACFL27_22865 [candidate division CSSED10-310 bacterium]|uniref:Uncharacterized protein n=1 Tax=candidate division CSSED10-310 bacterium TaxID=2855610 RepID=A0ABV6Z3N1_UNCC1
MLDATKSNTGFVILFVLLATTFFWISCDDDDDDTTSPATEVAFIVSTDFQTGSFTTISLEPPRTVTEDIGDICSDAIARYFNDFIYVVGRFNCDSIQVYDPDLNYALRNEYSVGAGTNPQDIAVINSQQAYISRLLASSLLLVDPATGQQQSEIDLSAYADSDGYPEMYLMFYLAEYNYLFIALQRLNTTTWTNEAPSYVIVIDTLTAAIKKAIPLQNLNPFTDFLYAPGPKKLYIGCSGAWGVPDGGIDIIDIDTLTVTGECITETELGGDILDFALHSADLGYALIADSNFITKVFAFNPTSGERGTMLLESSGYDLVRLAINDRQELWILDRTPAAPAIHIFNSADKSLIEKIALSGLPPFWILFL